MAVLDQRMGVVLQGEYEGYIVYIHEKNKSLEFVENVQPGWFSAPTPKVFIVDSSNIRSYRLISTHQESGASDISIGAAYLFIGRGAANSVKNAVQITMHKVEIVFNNGTKCLVDLKGDAFSTLETLCYSVYSSNANTMSQPSTIDNGDIDKNIEAVKKYKELLDMGIITQEEFNQKKQQLLGLGTNSEQRQSTHSNSVNGAKVSTPKQAKYEVVMINYGNNKINVIKAIRQLFNYGLPEANALAEKENVSVRAWISYEEAERICNALKKAGAVVEIREQ